MLHLSQKRVSSSWISAPPASCVDSGSAPKEAYLNASALSDPNSLTPYVSLLPYDLPELRTLVDSSSTHCFIDIKYALGQSFPVYSVSLIVLRIFDSTSNFVITQAIDFSVLFPASSDVTPMTFYLTPLDSECSIVLGHNWLTHHNLLIDWVLSSITFQTPAESLPMPQSTPSLVQPGNPDPGSMPSVDTLVYTPLQISLINAAAFVHTCNLEGSTQFQLQLSPSKTARSQSSSSNSSLNLSAIPPEYCDYVNVFSKVRRPKAEPRTNHHTRDSEGRGRR